jgi:two-component system response regulator YesN
MKAERTTIYLVDDEQPVLDGLSVTLGKVFPQLKICGKARSGMEALQGIAREKPDIIIMDVRMPGMSGIDTLREVNKILPDTVSILLTAYERFDIAQDAYALGVYKYLVKPVSQEVLTETISGALLRMEDIKSASIRAALEQERFEQCRPLLETGFIWSVIMGEPALFLSYGGSLGLADNGVIRGHFAVVARKRGRLNQDELGLMKREITNRLDCIPGPLFGGVFPLFVSGEKINRTRDTLRDALEVLDLTECKVSLGVVASGEELRLSCSQALLGVYREDPDLLIGERRDKTEAAETVSGLGGMIGLLKERDILALRRVFIEWSSDSSKAGIHDRAIMAGALVALLGAGSERILAAGNLQLLAGNAGTREAAEFAANLLIECLAATEETGEAVPLFDDRRIRRALSFIAAHHGEQISLEDAAAFVEISPAHLSRLFSGETGATFSHHLTQYRITRACKELREGNYSIKEIANLCGYPDANYFSRAFKKALGLTPSEWTEQRREK